MREIKFRAWMGDIGVMLMQETSSLRTFFNDLHPETSDTELMQFTGLLDKNGVEIYEGDVLKHPGKSIGGRLPKPASVIFAEGNWMCYFPIGLDGAKWVTRIGDSEYTGRFEIIGNIYENRELIERQPIEKDGKQ